MPNLVITNILLCFASAFSCSVLLIQVLLTFRDFLYIPLSQNLISHKSLYSFDIVIHKKQVLFLQLVHTLQFFRKICRMLIKSALFHHSRLIDSAVILHLKISYSTFMNCHSITHNKSRTDKGHIQVKLEFSSHFFNSFSNETSTFFPCL